MLTELSIRNFAIIEQVSVTFHDGLTVLTGETGAGKSIIIDAIQLLAGGRGSVDFVRHGAKKAEIEGLFSIDKPTHPVYEKAEQFGIEITDEQIVLERTITSRGKSICRVNGKLVTLAILKEFGSTLIDIHSQHETQSLMDPSNHLELLDMYEPELTEETKKEYTKIYDKLVELNNRYKKISENEQETAHRLDLLLFQKKELEQAELNPNEDIQLEDERQSLANYEQIFKSLNDAYFALYGEQKGLDWISQAHLALQDTSKHDPFIAEKEEEIANYYYSLEEMTFDIRNRIDSLQFDPERLNEIESRLNEINRLKKKYGATVDEMLEYSAKIEEEIEELSNKDSFLAELAKKIEDTQKDAFLEAKQWHDIRKRAAEQLIHEIHKELKGLYLEHATFSISFDEEGLSEEQTTLHKNGFDKIRFLISTNAGEPLKELSKTASGGELSRIMLVLKKIFAKHQGVTSVIFDEVDTGVSGRVAQAIAEKIHQISNDSQVICITHLPQVAAMADTHKFIRKKEKTNRTYTKVAELSKEEQTEELSRMITGTKMTATAKEHAKELLELASTFKQNN